MSDENAAEVTFRPGQDKPPMEFTYIRDGAEDTIRMSFGLLNVLMQSLGNYNNVALVGADPQINDIVLRKFFAKRSKSGKPTEWIEPEEGSNEKRRLRHELESMYDIDVSPDDTNRALFFIQCHMSDFMLRSLGNAAGIFKQTEAAQKRLGALSNSMSGQTGSPSSELTTPAA